MNLLEGLQDLFVCVSSFPNLQKMLDGAGEVALGHGREEGEKMEVEGGGTECPDEGECQGFLLMNMNITNKREKTEQVAQIPRSQAHHPCPHLIG
jgi:hypothetical protein